MTVKQAFETAYGPLPEGATCHAGFFDHGGETIICPTIEYSIDGVLGSVVRGDWDRWSKYTDAYGPDISDRPASSFLGFFGREYDNAVAIGMFNGGYAKDSPIPVPELREVKPEDLKPGAWIYYPDADEGTYIAVVDEVRRPNDDFKAFISKCGSRYGLDGAMVAVSEILHDHDKAAENPAENAGEGPDFARTEKE